jgi:ubiquinol-cytochrome c reductase cytochrome b subunit
VFLPTILFPGLTFTLFYAWPFIEQAITGDRREHQLLDRPRDRPKRTALGAGFLAFYFLLFCASSTDVLANFFEVSLNEVLWTFRIVVLTVPWVVGFVTYRICLDMAGVPGIGKRKRAVVVTRSAAGEYATHASEVRPGYEHLELEPEPVPTYTEAEGDREPVGVTEGTEGVRRVER